MLVREMTIGCHRCRFRHQGKVGIVSWIKMLRYGIDFRIESRGLENDLILGKVLAVGGWGVTTIMIVMAIHQP